MGLDNLTSGTKAFINFSKESISGSVPYLLPKENVVIEILERSRATQAMKDACGRLRAEGYTLALDDFVPSADTLPLIDLVNLVKVEYPAVDHDVQRRLIRKYGSRVRFLAEKIETRSDYQLATEIGYQLFQGYFFSKPAVVHSVDISSLNINMLRILKELHRDEPNFSVISGIIEQDLGLSYKLLKLANSAYFGVGGHGRIKSIQSALALLGIQEIYRWISMMMFQRIQNIENAEMIKLSLVRGKQMELLARALGDGTDPMEAFFTGMFSFIDVLLNRPMQQVLGEILLPERVKAALLGGENDLTGILACVVECEQAHWDEAERSYPMNRIGMEKFMELYFESLKWAQELRY